MKDREKDLVRLKHMRDFAREAVELAAERPREDMDADRTLQLALWHLLELVGEAAAHISEQTRSENTQIPWRTIVGTRHRLIHGYDMVDLDLIWGVIKQDLPTLIGQTQQIIDHWQT